MGLDDTNVSLTLLVEHGAVDDDTADSTYDTADVSSVNVVAGNAIDAMFDAMLVVAQGSDNKLVTNAAYLQVLNAIEAAHDACVSMPRSYESSNFDSGGCMGVIHHAVVVARDSLRIANESLINGDVGDSL